MDSTTKKVSAIIPAAGLIFGIYIVTSITSQIAHADVVTNCGTGELYSQGYWWFYSRQCDYKYFNGHLSSVWYIYTWWYSRTGYNPWFYCCQTFQEILVCNPACNSV